MFVEGSVTPRQWRRFRRKRKVEGEERLGCMLLRAGDMIVNCGTEVCGGNSITQENTAITGYLVLPI